MTRWALPKTEDERGILSAKIRDKGIKSVAIDLIFGQKDPILFLLSIASLLICILFMLAGFYDIRRPTEIEEILQVIIFLIGCWGAVQFVLICSKILRYLDCRDELKFFYLRYEDKLPQEDLFIKTIYQKFSIHNRFIRRPVEVYFLAAIVFFVFFLDSGDFERLLDWERSPVCVFLSGVSDYSICRTYPLIWPLLSFLYIALIIIKAKRISAWLWSNKAV